jgi:tetratricopeptide (TPR) repeat protein
MAYFGRARDRDTRGKQEAALEDYTMSIRLGAKSGRPGLDNIYGYRGDLLIRMNRFREAVGDYTNALLFSPSPQYYTGRAIALQAMGEVQQAREDFDMANSLSHNLK